MIVATGVLWETRRPRGPGDLIPMRPRDFLARAWSGEGELVLWPYGMVATSHDASRSPATRSGSPIASGASRSASDYGDGRVQRRSTYCEFVSDDHVRLTASDLPDGADVMLGEGGYRIAPWRMNWPLGPISLPIRCRDVSRVAPEGTFVNVIEARTAVFDLPLAQNEVLRAPERRRLKVGVGRRALLVPP